MDPVTRDLIQQCHQSQHRCALALTGGGTQAAGWLLNVPGGSRTLAEIQIPYSEQALVEYLGLRPSTFCSVTTSQMMAERAYARAQYLAPGQKCVGLGCTASLTTDRPRLGDHRFHVSMHSLDLLKTYSLILSKGTRSREDEETLLDIVLLNALAEACKVERQLKIPLFSNERVKTETSYLSNPIDMFLRGESPSVYINIDGHGLKDSPRPQILLSGSFNPMHQGHMGMAAAAKRLTGLEVTFELSVTNVDKPPLIPDQIKHRLHQFIWQSPVWLTRAPTFVEKAMLFPGVIFLVGIDTADRVLSPRYYQTNETLMGAALEMIRSQKCRFLVAGRVDALGKFVDLSAITIAHQFRDLFTILPENVFRADVSSTKLRF